MARYESMAECFGYTPVEMVEVLQVVLEDQAFSWYTRLQHSNPIMVAVDELKLIKQEEMAIGGLASFIL
ncbi:hypothetical protein BC941DRAFT_472690 [Chlamydoabsidia padenii]|nr:hypothetical protein BC941DRAFT_472690 [Chlamydoabsidia padenii]